MAFDYPSVQSPYLLCSSYDPALDLPDLPKLSDDASAEDKRALAALVKERDEKFQRALVTGNWKSITKPGHEPTFFKVQPLDPSTINWLRGTAVREKLTADEALEFVFRVAVKEIQNFGSLDLEFEAVGTRQAATVKSLTPLYNIGVKVNRPLLGLSIIIEIGGLAWERGLEGIGPLS